jgi:ribosomal protein S18 acetylase RimI-like enzyme
MTRDELIEFADLNFLEANRELVRRAGGVVHDEPGLLLYAGVHSLPVLVNGAMRTDGTLAPAEAIARASAFFAARRRGFTWLVRAHADADLEAAVVAAGAQPFGDAPGMVIEERLADAIPPAGIELRLVTTAAEVADFAAVNAAAYATYGMPADVAPAVLGRPAVTIAPHIRSFVAYKNGRALAAAMVILSHGIAGVYWVGTRPEARGQGLAELCTRAATNAGLDLGGRLVTLQASVMGEPIYRRMGYVEVTRYRNFVQSEPRRAA